MSPRTTAPSIIPITLPTPFAVGPVNCYLLRADPITLIDCGVGYGESRAALVRALAEHGLQPQDVRRLLLTHGHIDHLGQAAWFQSLGAEVWVHPLDLGKALHEEWYAEGQRGILAAGGVPLPVVQNVETVLLQGRRLSPALLPGYRLLAAGDRIPFDGFDLQVLHVPGHCIGHVAYWWEETGALFSGDLLLEGISPNPLAEPLAAGGRALTLEQFLGSLALVSGLKAAAAYPGHGPVVTAPDALITLYRSLHAQRLDQMAAVLPPEGVTAYSLAQRFYPRVQDWNIYLSLSEVLAHLDLLAAQGRARVAGAEAGVQRYYRDRE